MFRKPSRHTWNVALIGTLFGRRLLPTGKQDLPKMTKLFPSLMLLCNAGSAICYAAAGDFKRALYWGASTVCIAAITF